MRRPTIIDVARLAGVSKATAARVMSEQVELVRDQTRERVLKAVADLGYERNAIAHSLRTNRTYMIALCIPDITNPFWPEVARGIQDTLEASGYATMTVNSDWDADREKNYLQLVCRSRFDGLIINPMNTDATLFTRLSIPVVILGNGAAFPEFDSVGSDTENAVQEALEYLYVLGHRRVALIAGRSQRRRDFARMGSYRAFHQRHALPIDESLIIESDFSDRAGYDAMERLLALPQLATAVFAANDVLAIGALKAAQAAGRHVPRDFSIVGMDDIYAAAMTSPALTTIAKPKYEIGAQAATLLVERLKAENALPAQCVLPSQHVLPAQHIKLHAQFVQRASAGPLVN